MDQLTVSSHQRNMDLWISRIRECKASNQKVSDWCNTNAIGVKSYYYWMRKIKKEAFETLPSIQKTQTTKIAECSTTFTQLPLPVTAHADLTAVIVHIGHVTLEIKNGADESTLESTLLAIKNIC